MIPLPWLLAGGLALALAAGLGGYQLGAQVTDGKWTAKELARAERIVVRQEVLIREVPKIVTKTVERERIVEKEVDRVVTVIPRMLAPDCVLPERYGELLVGAARGIEPDPSTGRIDVTAGTYGCREVLEATLRDLKAGAQNSARLAGLQDYVRLLP